MHLRRWIESVAKLGLLMAVIAVAAPALADDKSDCEKESGDAAIAACDRAIDSGTYRGAELAKLYYWRGLERMSGDVDRAIKDFEDSIRIDPSQSSVFLQVGSAYRSKGDLDRAIAHLTDAIKLDPKETNPLYMRAGVYRAKGDYDRAIADYNAMIALDAEDADAYNGRGIAYAAKGDIDGAIEDYSSAISNDDEFAIAHSNRGDAYRQKGDLARAIEDYSIAAKLDADDPVTIYKRGNAYRARGDLAKAIDDYTAVIALAKDDADGFYERGVTHVLKRDFDSAIADLDMAIKLEAGHVPAYQARGLARAAKNQPEQALADYSEAVRLDPDNPDRYTVRAWQSFRMGRLMLAIADADHAIALDPDHASAHSTRARINEALGDAAAAEEDKKAAAAARAKLQEAERERVAALATAARARKDALVQGEKDFVAQFDGEHKYAYPLERAAIALGRRSQDWDEMTDELRRELAAYQKRNQLPPTGYLDRATLTKLIDEPVDVDLFKVDPPEDGKPVAFGDWFMTKDDSWCSVWAKPKAITGKFLPNFNELPLFKISRDISDRGNSISATFAEGDLYEKDAEVYILADGSRVNIERFGGDYGPERYCNNRGCFARDNVYKALVRASSFKVIGPSKLGGELVIEYSPRGFRAAFQRMNSQCAKGRIGSWLQ